MVRQRLIVLYPPWSKRIGQAKDHGASFLLLPNATCNRRYIFIYIYYVFLTLNVPSKSQVNGLGSPCWLPMLRP